MSELGAAATGVAEIEMGDAEAAHSSAIASECGGDAACIATVNANLKTNENLDVQRSGNDERRTGLRPESDGSAVARLGLVWRRRTSREPPSCVKRRPPRRHQGVGLSGCRLPAVATSLASQLGRQLTRVPPSGTPI